jgi:hypothetical protein
MSSIWIDHAAGPIPMLLEARLLSSDLCLPNQRIRIATSCFYYCRNPVWRQKSIHTIFLTAEEPVSH